ncbi:MAG TPA: hypothetical protein PKD49_15270 [Hyphomicrobium sp.]|nr:hypothetical protein [Hyphomicrobium sp.]
MDLPARLTSTQKGTVTEYLVAASIVLASSGRLSPFVPLSDDHGIDLIALDKATQRSVCLQVKSAVASPKRKTVQFDVQKSTFKPAPDVLLLAILFEPATVSVGTSWLIPMAEVPSVSVDQADKYALTPSMAALSKDRYQRYRHEGPHSLVAALLRVFDAATSE